MKKITISFVALSHLLTTSLYAGSTSFTLSGSALTIDPSIITIAGSGGDTGKTGTGGSTDTSKLASGGSTGGTTFLAAPSTGAIFTPPPIITTIDPSVLTTALGTGGSGDGSGGSSVEATGGAPVSISVLTADAPPTTDTAKTSPSLLDSVITTLSDITTTIIDTIIPPSTPTTTDTTTVATEPTTQTTTTTKDTTTVATEPTTQTTTTTKDTTTVATEPTTQTTTTTKDTTTVATEPTTQTTTTTKDTTTVATEPTTQTTTTTKDTTTVATEPTTQTTTTTKDTTTVATEPTLIDKVVDAVTTVIKDVVDLASSSPTANPSPFTPDYCFHLPFMDTCSACLSTKQVLEKVNDLNSDLINQGIDAYKYGYKLDWSLRSGKFITLNPDGSENTAVLSFNICEASSSEICELPIRNTVSATEYPTYTLDNLLIFSFMHPEQANKTAAICSTLPNCAASLTTLSNGQYGLSMKISDVKKTLCIEAYHGKILEISEKDPMLVTCLAEIPVCQPPVEETKIIEPAIPTTPTAEPTQTITPTDPKVVEPTPTTQPTDTKVVDTTTKPQPTDTTATKTVEPVAAPENTTTVAATEPAKAEPTPQTTSEQTPSLCETNPMDPSCFPCLITSQAIETRDLINQVLMTMPEPRPSPLTLSFDWNNNTGTITAPPDHQKLTSYTFAMCDRPDAVCTSSQTVIPDLNYLSLNGINSLFIFSSINSTQAEQVSKMCTLAKPTGSCTASIQSDTPEVTYLRIKTVVPKDSCLPIVGGEPVSEKDADGNVTCIFKKTICSVAQKVIPPATTEATAITPTPIVDKIIPETITPKSDTPVVAEAPIKTPDSIVHETTTTPDTSTKPAPLTTDTPAKIIETPTPETVTKTEPVVADKTLPTTHETIPAPIHETVPEAQPEVKKFPITNATPTASSEHPFTIIPPPATQTKETPPSKEAKPEAPITVPTVNEIAQKQAIHVIFCEEGSLDGFYVDTNGNKIDMKLKSPCPAANIFDNDQSMNERKEMMDYLADTKKPEHKTLIKEKAKKRFDTILSKPEEKVDVITFKAPMTEDTKTQESTANQKNTVSETTPNTQENTQDTVKIPSSEMKVSEEKTESVNGEVLKEILLKDYERADDTTFVSKKTTSESEQNAKSIGDLMIKSNIGALTLTASSSSTENTGQLAAVVQPYPLALEMRGTGCSLIIK